MFPKSLMFWSFEELEIFNGNGSETIVFFLFSNLLKLLDERRTRMNNRTGKAETKFVLVGDDVV